MNTNIKIYTDSIDELARKQLSLLMEQPAFADAKVRIMPDVHAGKGCVIGFTADLGNKVIPNIVGVDIGCGMLTIKVGKRKPDFAELDDIMHRNIPSGMNVRKEAYEEFPALENLHCFDRLAHVHRLRRSIGTLGGGNHFVEVDVDSQGDYYIIIHSGSRNLGLQVCELYQQEAIDTLSGFRDPLTEQDAIITRMKEEGRAQEIGAALAAFKAAYRNRTPSVPRDLCYLEGEARERYLADMRICQQFALRSRDIMGDIIVSRLGLEVENRFHTVHNYIDHESNIVRKGAISARAGEPLLIPINMRDGCIYGIGKGNEDWNYSAPHGAGRIMSRTAARRQLSVEEFREQMEGIYSTSIGKETLDEAPMAYKGIDAILGHLSPTVDVVDIFKPVYNFKAADDFPRFGKRA